MLMAELNLLKARLDRKGSKISLKGTFKKIIKDENRIFIDIAATENQIIKISSTTFG